ncbi:hypothetical protein GCM10010174_76230 [Kutzneria viridogrisea]|uniref:YcxB-like protein domain-containing protein n=2 Tax=Kutzneria TaxID=43356 RepID=A0ABR6BNE1_9PSEU|nr:YcxB family protein [Kutzneria albida]AHH96376.1 putative membrane protein [Kutzneria albida DSM 43870]MBA8928409.1 hypothetical protein [Kutzneria viridogrisea]
MYVEFSWEPEPADRRDALRAVAPVVRWAPWFAAALAAMSAVLLVAGNASSGALGMIAAAAVLVIVPWQARLLYRDNLPANQLVLASADEFALRMSGPASAPSELAWTALRGWQETEHGIVLRTGSRPYSPVYSVPHRAFAAPSDEHGFRELLIRRVGPVG